MSDTIEAVVHVVWDEEGNVAAHMDAEEAAEILESESNGKSRRVLALRLTLPVAGPVEMAMNVADDTTRLTVRRT